MHHAPVKEAARPYQYEYGVSDSYSGAQFQEAQAQDAAGVVVGSYSVALPDGRVQHVKYTADHYGGYVAEVSYEGTAHFPEYKPAPYKPPVHKPAPPVYKPAPPVYKPAPPVYAPAPHFAGSEDAPVYAQPEAAPAPAPAPAPVPAGVQVYKSKIATVPSY